MLAEPHRALVSGGKLVVGFFDGDEIEAFEHKVVTTYRWPADELSARGPARWADGVRRPRRG